MVYLLLLAGGVQAQQAALTEDRYVALVLLHSLEAQVVAGEAALGRTEAVGVGLSPNPSVEWQRESGGGGSTGGRQDMIFASVPLVLSGRLGLEREAASRGALAAAARADRALAELRWQATRAFSAVLAAKQSRHILAASYQALQELTQMVQAREHAGSAAGYDRLRMEVERASIEGLLREAIAREKRAAAEALRLLGPSVRVLPPLEGMLPAPRALPSLSSLAAELPSRRADARALALQAESAESARRAAARGWLPEPTVNAGVQLLDLGPQGHETGYVVGISLPLPLFQRRQGEQARAAAERDLANARHAGLLHAAQTRLASAFDEVTSRRDQLARHRSEVLAKTAELRKIAGAAYRGGSSDLLVLVDAERAAREAELVAIDLAAALVEAETDLLFASGAYDTAPAWSPTR